MNEEKGCIRIDVGTSGFGPPHIIRRSGENWIRSVWEFAKEDTNRVKFGFKVDLAVLLASLLVLIREPYEVFGATNIIWAILTVAIMFEYSVGATFSKGFNRAVGSLSAVILAMVMIQIATSCGRIIEPYIIGFSIFIVAMATSFMKLWPPLTQYEYGFRVVLLTYCMIVVSSFRMNNLVKIVVDRLYSIAMGGIIAVLVSTLVFPVWCGDQLHKELAGSFTLVADALEECVNKYLRGNDGTDMRKFSKMVVDENLQDEPAFRKCRDIMNSSAKLDFMASSANWEPPHGKFLQLFYPWPKYVQVGAVLRYCSYEVMALHDCLHSEIQAPYNLRLTFQSEILEVTRQAAEFLRNLGDDISKMKCTTSLRASQLKCVYSATEGLQRSIDVHSYLLIFPYEFDGAGKRKHMRLYSWPSREVDDFEGDEVKLPGMQRLESAAAAMSLATFTSLLIEFIARMDHLVDVVDELAKMAKFRKEDKV